MRPKPVFIVFILTCFLLVALPAMADAGAESYKLNALCERVLWDLAAYDPQIRTYNSEALSWCGLPDCPEDWVDASDDPKNRLFAALREDRTQLQDLDDSLFTPGERMTAGCLAWYLDTRIQGEKYKYHNFSDYVQQGVLDWYTSLTIAAFRVHDEKSAHSFINRLSRCSGRLDVLLRGLRIREERGLLPGREAIEHFYLALRLWATMDADVSPPYECFVKALQEINGLEPDEARAMQETALLQIRKNIQPGLAQILKHLENSMDKAPKTLGIWQLPEGDGYYRYLMRSYTGTDLSPEALHQIGLAEVNRLQKALTHELSTLGLKKPALGDNLADARSGGRDSEPADPLWEARRILAQMESALPEMFDWRPANNITVRDGTSTFYIPPSTDGKKPAWISFSPDLLAYSPRLKVMVYHEGIPGHHLHTSFVKGQTGRPLVLRLDLPQWKAMDEGWAHYAERLAGEYGFYDTPRERIEALYSEYFTTLGLVIDTGIHYKRWDLSRASAFYTRCIGMPVDGVRYEIMPGGICSYKVGQFELLRIRKKAREALGRKFDIRQFHSVVLNCGRAPFRLIESEIDRYIQSARPVGS